MDQAKKHVEMISNPLYPERTESNAMGVLLAVVSVIVAIILLVVIVTNFSYALHPQGGSGYVSGSRSAADAADGYGPADGDESYMEEVPAEGYGQDAVGEGTLAQDSEIADEGTAAQNAGETGEETEVEAADAAGAADYVLPESSVRYLERADLENLTAEQLRIARNEIYARHGRLFDDEQLQEYFNGKEWYNGTISPADFSEDMLNDFERENTYTITDYEVEMGYR